MNTDCPIPKGQRNASNPAYISWYRKQKHQECPCGNPAIKWKCGFVCERCDKLEDRSLKAETIGYQQLSDALIQVGSGKRRAEWDWIETKFEAGMKPVIQFTNNILTIDAHGHYEFEA